MEMKKRIMAALLAICMAAGYAPYPAAHVQAEEMQADTYVGLDAEYHTQEEIREYYKSHPIKNMEAEFVTEPSVAKPYALGELTEETKQDALNMLNLYRYIAGVPEASISDELQSYAQAAALVCAINKKLDHQAEQPEGMDDEMYSQAIFGVFNSNLSSRGNVLNNTIRGHMLESNGDSSFGHRRQLLDYSNVETGFGMAQSETGGYYSATFVGSSLIEDKVISYPGQNQPLEYFGAGYAWTVIVPETVDEMAVNVELTDMKTGRTWNYNRESGNFRLDKSFGSTCVIFFPRNIDYSDGDQYKVEITGIQTPISYEVHMFLLGDPVPIEKLTIDTSGYFPLVGTDDITCDVDFVPENATNKTVIWTSSDLDIAEPENLGGGVCRIIAKKEGKAVFTATSEDGGHTQHINITVRPRATALELSTTEATIGVGQTFHLESNVLPEETREWAHFKNDYDENIIELWYAGIARITGKAVGRTSLTAYTLSNPNVTAVCNINVVEPVYTRKLWFDKTEIDLTKGDVIKLEPLYSPANITCKELEWSSNSTCVDVEKGQVKAVREGKAVITVKALDGSGKETQCIVSVYKKHEKADAPQLEYATCNEIALVDGGWWCEYSMDLENWQESNVFRNLEPDQAYTFYIRYGSHDYMKAGEASEGAVFRTKAVGDCLHTDKEVRGMKQASCLENGYTGDTYCKDCGEKLSEGEVTEAAGHKYASKVTKKPTASEEGVRTYTCIRCGYSYTKAIPKLQPADGAAENISKAVVTISKGTCNYTGKAQKPTVKTVKLGQRILNPDTDYAVKYRNNVNIGTASVIITGKGHYTGTVTKKFSIAARKGSRFTAGKYRYQITGTSEVAFSGLSSSKAVRVAIPKTVKIGGKVFKVTSVAKNAFKKTKITSVSIGDNVKAIGVSAFEGCAKLSKATLGKGIIEISGNAFKNCKKLGTITIKSTKLKKVGRNVLKGIKPTAKIKVPAKKVAAYKKLFKNKGQGRKVKIAK